MESLSKMVRRKPLWFFQQEYAREEMPRVYDLKSLVAIGIGGTVGSGIFVLSGFISATMAGPATALSWLIAGLCCAVTALCYCELAAVLRSPGSAYAFAYYGLGEVFALVAAYLVTLEYGISGAAVARSWSDKLAYWVNINEWGCADTTSCWINAPGGSVFNPMAFVLSALTVALILCGAELSKQVVNVLVVIKVALVVFVLVVGAVYTNPANLVPFVPLPQTAHNGSHLEEFQGGVSGVLSGATAAFFGYIGFDEVTCMVAESHNPTRNIPLAVMITILSVSAMYIAGSVVLTGMVPYDQIDQNEGFGSAFVAVGARWAMQVTVLGEIIFILPTVVLVCYLPQSRILYAVSKDGQLPRIFSRISKSGNIWWGSLISGSVCTLVAAFVPFENLWDLISGGILLSFIFTNSSLLLARSKHRDVGWTVLPMVLLMLFACFILNKTDLGSAVNVGLAAAAGALALVALALLHVRYDFSTDIETFKVPLVPLVPSVAIFVNCFLLTQLSWLGLGLTLGLAAVAVLTYLAYGFRHAVDFDAVQEVDEIERGEKGVAVVTVVTSFPAAERGPAESGAGEDEEDEDAVERSRGRTHGRSRRQSEVSNEVSPLDQVDNAVALVVA
jgi:APA family basic amino acid/polyamine antiporter